MKPTVKTLLVWLLMLVLPLHAVAANVGMACALGSATLDMTASVAAAGKGPHHEGHALATGHLDGAHADAVQADGAQDDGCCGNDGASKGHSSCSACSVLCIGAAAPPSSFLPLPTFDGSEAVALLPAPFAAGFIPDGLQRPPRG